MFKKRALQVKVVKDPKPETQSSTVVGHWHVEPEQFTKLLRETVKTATVAAIALYVAKKSVDTGAEIVINLTSKK
jgi:hypothetical protein